MSRGIAIVAAALSLTALAGVASGAGRSAAPASIAVEPGVATGVTATCPAGTRAISGGFEAPEFDNQGSATVRFGSMRTAKKDWRVDAVGLGGDRPGRMIAHAYCLKPPLRIRVVTASATIETNSLGGVSASCLRDEQAISGGFTSPDFGLAGGAHALALSSYRVGRGAWRVEGINPTFDEANPAASGRITAYAFCRRGGPHVITRAAEATVDLETGIRTFDAVCPAGTTAISGGFDGHASVSENGISGAGPISSVRLPSASGWRTTAVPVSENPGTATGYAYCQRNRR